MKVVWGIDPGYTRIGWATVAGTSDTWELVAVGVIGLEGLDIQESYAFVFQTFRRLRQYYPPDLVGVEKVVWNRAVTTALRVAEMRGFVKGILLGVMGMDVPIIDVTPTEVKSSVGAEFFGKGKEAVRLGIEALLKNDYHYQSVLHGFVDDGIDAIAVAIAAGDKYAVEGRG